MILRKHGELMPRKAGSDLKNGSGNTHTNGSIVISGDSFGSSSQKAVFEKDFPSLGSEDRQGVPDIARVSSPGLSSSVQSLPVGSSALIVGEGWTSALAEVPAIIANSSTSSSSAVHTVVASSSGASSGMTGLNMAETLTQAPSRTRTAPQVTGQGSYAFPSIMSFIAIDHSLSNETYFKSTDVSPDTKT